MKDGLAKMADVLREQNLVGDEWAKYMGIKSRLLRRQYLFMMNPSLYRSLKKMQPLVRIRGGKVVWHGVEDGDFLSKVSILDMEYLNNPEKHGFQPCEVSSLKQICETTVWFPSEDKADFIPSTVHVLQQMPENIKVDHLLFEIRLSSAEVCNAYDSVLGCHQAEVIFYRLLFPKLCTKVRQGERMLPDCEEEKKDRDGLNDIKVKTVNQPKKPLMPKRQLPSR